MNNCTFTGNLGKDAVTRYTQGGKSVTVFSLAVKTGWGDNEKTLWIDCSLLGERGEKLAQYLTRGTKVCVCGEASLFEADNGKTYLKLNVRDIDMMGRSGGHAEASERQESQKPKQSQSRNTAYASQAQYDAQGEAFADDDLDSIPF